MTFEWFVIGLVVIAAPALCWLWLKDFEDDMKI